MRIVLVDHLKENAPPVDNAYPHRWDELDSSQNVEAILDALRSADHEAIFLEPQLQMPHDFFNAIQKFRPHLCFNLTEGHFGDARESHVPAILEMLQLPYTGSRVTTLAVALNKALSKRIFRYYRLPTPRFQVFETPDDRLHAELLDEQGELRFPMLLKPNQEGTSIGISKASLVSDVLGLREQLRNANAQFNQPILCEEYIQGREFTVGILGNPRTGEMARVSDAVLPQDVPAGVEILPVLEVDLSLHRSTESDLYTNRMKTELGHQYRYDCPAKIPPALEAELRRLTYQTFAALDCKDVARVDFRVDSEGKPYVLEINPVPGLTPGWSDLCLAAQAYGWSYATLINRIVDAARERHGI